MELEEIKTLTIKAVQEFNEYDDDTNYGPEMKQIDIVKRRVEELMFKRNPNSPRADTRYSNETPTVMMDRQEEKVLPRIIPRVNSPRIINVGKGGW